MSATIISTGFSTILYSHFGFTAAKLRNGEELVRSQHVSFVQECRRAGFPPEVTGRCLPQTNISKNMYEIKIVLDSKRKILRATCTCTAGQDGLCKHVASVICFVNEEREETKTSKPCSFNQPSQYGKNRYPKGQTAEKLFEIADSVSLNKSLIISCGACLLLQNDRQLKKRLPIAMQSLLKYH